MLFNSIGFLIFFPLVVILYYIIPHRYRWLHLLLASCIFYMFFIPYYILILFITILIDYFAGILIERSSGRQRQWYLWMSIISTCLVLMIFKYYNFFILNFNELAAVLGWNYSLNILKVILPIGLSFHTFQSLSYVIEVYRGNQKAEKNFGIYSLYVMYWPQLVAGPIERPQNLLHQFRQEKKFKFRNFYSGLRLILFGFFMKLVVADRLGIYVDAVYNNASHHSGISFALATIFFSFQIYCDFAGYSAIAIGASRVMGIHLMTNFRRPYLSRSVSEFWRRWHISLSTWFKDYVYIPLGGSKVDSKARIYFNLMITFTLSGFWHGASWTFVIWGALNGFYLIVENSLKSSKDTHIVNGLSFLKTFYVYLLICFSWIFFRANTITDAFHIINSFLHWSGSVFMPADPEVFVYCILAVALVVFTEVFYEKVYRNRQIVFNRRVFINATMLVLFFLILLMGVFDGGQFIYFQF